MGEVVTVDIGILFLICLVISSIGFYRLMYFISLGYGFSMAAMGVAVLVFYGFTSVIFVVHTALLVTYGLRLGIYLLRREKTLSYKNIMAEIRVLNRTKGLVRKIAIWLGVSLLYVLMFLPVVVHSYRIDAGFTIGTNPVVIVGILMMGLALILVTIADNQKSVFKKSNQYSFCNIGLYRLVRCPNYFGEMLFWTGHILTALIFMNQLTWLAVTLVGYVCIILVMLGSTKRLEIKQNKRYGHDEAYWDYCLSTPVLIPMIPIYSLKNLKVYLG